MPQLRSAHKMIGLLGILVVASVFYLFFSYSRPNDTEAPKDLSNQTAKHSSISLKARHARIAQRAKWLNKASDLNNRLKKALPDDFGSLWIGLSDRRIKVGLAHDAKVAGSASLRIAKQNVAELDLQDAVDYIRVKYAYAELISAINWMEAQIRLLDGRSKWPIQTGITTDTNQILLGIPKDYTWLTKAQQDLLQNANTRFGDMIKIETYTELPHPD